MLRFSVSKEMRKLSDSSRIYRAGVVVVSSTKRMRSRTKSSRNKDVNGSRPESAVYDQDCYEGDSLILLLESIQRAIELSRASDGNSLPEKIWLKKQFAIGVNDVTRVLEQTNPSAGKPHVHIQAILVAADCTPRWLIKHLPSLASLRKVPVFFVRDNKKGSLRLGELVKLKTAIALGVKAQGNAINQFIEKFLNVDEALGKLPAEPKISDVPC